MRGHRFILISLLAGSCLSAANAEESADLARFVPADVGLFVEVRGVEDLLARFTDPQIWSTLAEFAGQPSQPEDVAEWRARIRQTIKMEPEEAIRTLFSRGVAFVGEGLGLSQDAVVLCQPGTPVEELLKRWDATRVQPPADPPTYQLYNNIGVSIHDSRLYFGDLIPPAGLFRRMQKFVTGGYKDSLADDAAYAKLLTRVPEKPDGLFFLRGSRSAALPMPALTPGATASAPTSQPSTQPAEASAPDAVPPPPVLLFENPLRNANNILLALHRRDALLCFTAVADRREPGPASSAEPVRLIQTLPLRTLLAWQGRFEFAQAADAFLKSLEQNPISGVFQIPEQVETLRRFIAALDTDVCVALGTVFPKERLPGTPPFPALALLTGTRDPETVVREIRNVVNVGIAGYSVYAYTRGLPLLEPIREFEIGGSPAYLLDLSPLLKTDARNAIGEIQLCWMIHEQKLIIATHSDWLRQIVESRVGRSETLAPVMDAARAGGNPSSVQAVLIHSGPIGDIAAAWIEYLRRHKPEVFDENWWREHQPGGGQVRLGIDARVDVPGRRLSVVGVQADLPAYGRLRPGDFIVGYGDRYGDKRFQSEDLIGEMTRAIRERPHARWLVLLVERDGITQRMRLPIPFIAPVQALNRVIAIGKIAQRAVYCDDSSDMEGPRGYLTIELRTGEKSLFDFSEPTAPPTSAPAPTPEPDPPPATEPVSTPQG